jgi:hypothetical protein
MSKTVDPKNFGLPSKNVIEEISHNHLAIVISRKSRVIMADGRKILEKTNKIKKVKPGSRISVRITGPLCSKTKQFLKENNIEVI